MAFFMKCKCNYIANNDQRIIVLFFSFLEQSFLFLKQFHAIFVTFIHDYCYPMKTVVGFLKYLSLLLILLNSINLRAERVRLFGPDDGLSNSHINQIYQDSKGYIWIATENGLNKFNGYEFEVYSSVPNDSTSLHGNFVSYIYEDSCGLFWVATSNGLLRYDREKNNFFRWRIGDMDDLYKERRTNFILEDRNNNLWISYPGNCLLRLDAKTLSPVVFNRNNSGITDFTISCMIEDKHGNLWLGTEEQGVFVFNLHNYTTKHYKHNPANLSSLSNNRVFAICEDSHGAIWVGTVGGGINVFDEKTQSFRTLKGEKTSMENLIYCLMLDNNQTVWAGTDGAGIFRYDLNGHKTPFWEERSSVVDLRKAKVHALFQDRQGNIWAALHQKGALFISASANYFSNIGFNRFDASKSIGSCCVISIMEDHTGNVWVGTDGDGLYRIHPSGKIDHFTVENSSGFQGNVITALFEAKDHHIWIGTYLNGFFRYNSQTKRFDAPYPYNHVTSFAQDDEGTIWIGTNGSGVSLFNPKSGKFKQYLYYFDSERDQISSNWVFDVLIDREKGVWAATSNGLHYLNREKDLFEVRQLAGDNSRISNLMYTLHEDSKGDIWAGSYYGLHHLDKSTGKSVLITTLDGLPDNMIAGIEEDADKTLWVSTGKGLCRYNPELGSFLNYYAQDGIQSNEFRRGSHFKGVDDRMYFGGINGITTFYPAQISHENKLLDIVFTGISVYDKPVQVDHTGVLRLKYNLRSFTISFAALEYGMPQRVNYFTQMENFDTQWRQINSANRNVTYTNLNRGSYVFRVKATIDGKNVLQKEMQVVILPPWWWSVVAKITYLLLFIALLYSIYNYFSNRIRRRREDMEKEQQKQLSESKLQFFTDISHEIRTPLTLIIAPLEKMLDMKVDSSMRVAIRIMYQNAIRILRLINQLMDLRAVEKRKLKLKVEEVDILEFLANIMDSFTNLASSHQIAFNLKADDELPQIYIDKDCIDKVIFNLLSNAFKFTPKGGNITVDVKCEGIEQLLITVRDSGIGISKEEQKHIFDRFYQVRDGKRNSIIGTGIGLHLAKVMAEMHHGSLQVESEPEQGSAFHLRIPLQATVYKADEFGTGNEEAPATMFQPSVSLFIDEKEVDISINTKRRGGESVLVVEDDADILRYIELELSANYRVYTAVNGKEGLTKALHYLPDVIVSDIVMPEKDGLTLCKLIKTNEKTCHIPVILLTAKTTIEQRIEGIEAGADSYITKPFNIKHLKTRIERLIQLREKLKQKYTGELEVDKEDIKVVTSDEKLLYRFNEKMKEHLANPDLNVDFICKELGISRVQLNRRLQEMVNDSPGNYIRNYRLKQAAWLLQNKKMTIAEVGYAVGFTSQAYFSTLFKKHYGMSPTEYGGTT